MPTNYVILCIIIVYRYSFYGKNLSTRYRKPSDITVLPPNRRRMMIIIILCTIITEQ